MNISIDQYRMTIGLHNTPKIKFGRTCREFNLMNFLFVWFDSLLDLNFSKFTMMFFLYTLIINYLYDLLEVCVQSNLFYSKPYPQASLISRFGVHNHSYTLENYRILLGCLSYCFFECSSRFFALRQKNGQKMFYRKLFPKISVFDRTINMLSMLLLFLHFTLISLTIPNISNPGPTSKLNVLYHNVRGFVDLKNNPTSPQLYQSKVKEFQGLIFSEKPDIVILNETWLKKSILSSEIFPNKSYNVFRRDRSMKSHPPDVLDPNKFKRNGGGVLIAVRSDLEVESCVNYNISGGDGVAKAEILSIVLKPKTGKSLCFSTLYRVGTLGAENFHEVDRHLRYLFKSKPNAHHILMGDFNLSKTKWPSGLTNCHTEKRFIDLFEDLNLEQLIHSPTHKDGKILDLLLTNQPYITCDLNIHPSGTVCNSDHYSIGFKVNLQCKRLKSPKRKIYNLKKADFKSINNELDSIPWNFFLDYDNINSSLEKFEDIFFSICDKHIPKVTVKSSYQPPWFDSELDNLCKRKVKLLNTKKRTSDPLLLLEIDEEVRRVRKEYKKKVDEKKIDNVTNDDDPALLKKKFWSFFKSTSNSTRIPETMNYGSKVRSSNKEVANMFNQYFFDQLSDPSKYDIEIDFSNDPFRNMFFDEKTIFDLLIKTNVNKAAGPDKMDSKLMKYCARGLSKPLTIIFNRIFKTGKIPDKWKLANVVPILKKGDKSSVTNYRPISLTSLPMKVLEYCIKNLLLQQCSDLIRDVQHGFSIEKSCLTQLLPLIDKISVAMNNKSRIDVIYFDFAKAFDSVSHDLILYKLKNKYGIDGLLLNFLKNYLINRKQQVVINGSLSDPLRVSSGVPQGSILGPLLFILFIDDIFDEVSKGTNIELYADDTKIWREIICDKDQFNLQQDINKLHEWSIKNLMNFHPEKCKAMAITNKCRDYVLPFYEFWYQLDNKLLSYVDNEKDLGVVFNHKLSWTNHCNMVVHKANNQFNLLRRTCYFINNPKQRRALYLTLVRSLFEHCCQIWSPQNPTSLIMFEKLQKRAVKWILKEQHDSYSDFIFLKKQKELDILPMRYKFLFADLVMFYRIISNDIKIELPHHISKIEPQDVKSTTRLSQSISDGSDNLQYRCKLHPKVKCFQDSYFVRAVKNWNNIPVYIRKSDSLEKFKVMLKEHLWLILGLEPD